MTALAGTDRNRMLDRITSSGSLSTHHITGFVGRTLRASRLSQSTQGLSEVFTGIDHTLVYHISGGPAERFEGGKCTGRSDKIGTSTFVPAFSAASWLLHSVTDVLHLYVDDSDLRRFAAQEYDINPDRLEMHDHMGVEDAFMKHLGPLVIQELQSDLPQSHLMLDGFDTAVAAHLLRDYSNMSEIVLARDALGRKQGDHKAVCRVREILTDNLAEDIGLEDLADEVGVSLLRLMRLFKAEMGMTIRQFVVQERVAFVRQKLSDTNETLAAIAVDAGFTDQPHMSSTFKAMVGVSPASYRRATRL
ncbi:MAG: AraC family transcriptional regulator [Pseudomonadota bacterium]